MVTNKDVIVLIGQQSFLPWVDGIQYAISCVSEPRLWLPSHRQPSVPIELLASTLYQQYQQAPLLLWHQPKVIVPLNKPQIVTQTRLKSLLGEQ